MIYSLFLKRFLDTLLAICGLIVLCVPMLVIAICIKLDSQGPVFFIQERLGKDMKPINVVKFRTMCDHAYEIGGLAKSSNDSRITRVGSILRRTSLDELPQMFNIINGTMAIIGPRPILDWEFEPYKENKEFCKRYNVKAGMFCTVDVDYRASADRDLQFKMDAAYADHVSFALDTKIFFSIIKTVIKGDNVYVEDNKIDNNEQ